MIECYDYHGNPTTLDSLQAKYGPFVIQQASPPDGYAGWVWKVWRIWEKVQTYAAIHNRFFDKDGNNWGQPLQFCFGWPDAPALPDAGPLEGRPVGDGIGPNRGVRGPIQVNPDNTKFDIDMGQGAFYHTPNRGPYYEHGFGSGTSSDVFWGLGMLGLTNHDHLDVDWKLMPADDVTPPPPPPPPIPSTKRLSLHFQTVPDWATSFVDRAEGKLRYVKVMDPPVQNPFPNHPELRIIGRTYMPDSESNALVAQGAAGANVWFNHWFGFYSTRSYIWAWEGPNEPQPMNQQPFRAKLDEFTVELARLMHVNGKKLVGHCWSVGNPEVEQTSEFRNSLAVIDYLGVHEYSAPTMQHGEGYYCLRINRVIEHLKAQGCRVPDVLVTECGIDGLALLPPIKSGWRTYASESQYLEQLKWYDGNLAPEVKMAAVFNAGGYPEWYDYEVSPYISNGIADWVKSDPVPPPPPIEPAKGFDISAYQDQPLDWWAGVNAGNSFAILRFSIGYKVDTRVLTLHLPGSEGIPYIRFAYHGLDSALSGDYQGRLAVGLARSFPVSGGCLDVEAQHAKLGVVKAFVDAWYNRTDADLIFYSNPYGIQILRSQGDISFLAKTKLWIAHHNVPVPTVPAPWTKYTFWQTGIAKGPEYPKSICRDRYNGTVAQLKEEFGFIPDW